MLLVNAQVNHFSPYKQEIIYNTSNASVRMMDIDKYSKQHSTRTNALIIHLQHFVAGQGKEVPETSVLVFEKTQDILLQRWKSKLEPNSTNQKMATRSNNKTKTL
jgi:hypothetical protein